MLPTFILRDFIGDENMRPVREVISKLDEGFLDDGKAIKHHQQPAAHVQAEHVPVLTPPRPELGPGVLVHQVQVTQQRQGGAGARG